MTDTAVLDQLCITTLRTLAMDAVQQAQSGHPGTPMGAAPTAYCLWQRFLVYDPRQPEWPNRDRFVLSAGHASALLYSLLYLCAVQSTGPAYSKPGGLAVTMDDLKTFRQVQSMHWPSGTRLDQRRGDYHRAARARRGHQRRHGDRASLEGSDL